MAKSLQLCRFSGIVLRTILALTHAFHQFIHSAKPHTFLEGFISCLAEYVSDIMLTNGKFFLDLGPHSSLRPNPVYVQDSVVALQRRRTIDQIPSPSLCLSTAYNPIIIGWTSIIHRMMSCGHNANKIPNLNKPSLSKCFQVCRTNANFVTMDADGCRKVNCHHRFLWMQILLGHVRQCFTITAHNIH